MIRGKNLARLFAVIIAHSFAFVCVAQGAPATLDPPVVRAEGGLVQGTRESDIIEFKGVPFAAPPIGSLRWRAPLPVEPWRGVRHTDAFGADCASNPEAGTSSSSRVAQSEDCLFLNIWRPANAARPLPVLVWIYGGGFTTGGSSPAGYDGANLARQGVVLVSINYRVGQLGFFAHPALAREQAGRPRGNYGFLDQIAAMAWIRKNIRAFGGDDHNVTVFGESAGGFSVHMLLMSPLAKGLVDKAIIESGGGRRTIMTGQRMSDDGTGKRPAAEATGLAWAKSHGIEGSGAAALRALRALPTAAVLDGIGFLNPLYAGPMIDGAIIPYNMMTAYESGRFAHVPIIIGSTSGDMSLNRARTKDELFAAFGDTAERARAVYDRDGHTEMATIRTEEGADEMMHETARFTAERFSAARLPAYLYRFGYVAIAERNREDATQAAAHFGAVSGAFHGAEIPYVFDNVAARYGSEANAQDEAMGQLMSAYWIAFAKTGNPNGDGRPVWKPFAPDGKQLLLIDNTRTGMSPDPWQDRLDVVEVLNQKTRE